MKSRFTKSITLIFFIVMFLCSCANKQASLRDEGIEVFESGDYASAVELFTECLETKAGTKLSRLQEDVLKYRADAYIRLENYVSAAEDYIRLLDEADEDDTPLYKDLIAICITRSNGDLDLALEYYRASQGSPLHDDALETLANASNIGYESYRATIISLFTDAFAEDGRNHLQLYNALGMIYMNIEAYQDALEAFESGLEVDETSIDLSYVNDEEVRSQKIIEYKRQLLYNKAVANEYLGHYATAKEDFEEYIRLYGSNLDVQHEIDFLTTR